MENKNNMGPFPMVITIILASIGTGMICTTVITSITGGYNLTVFRYIIWIIASALYGLFSYLIFGKERLSFALSVALHCVVCLAITVAACFLCRFDMTSTVWIEIIIIFIVVYAIIFCITYLCSRAEAKKINEKINRR